MEGLRGIENSEYWIEDCINSPELINELTPEEVSEIAEVLLHKILEIYEPYIKAKYLNLLQKLGFVSGDYIPQARPSSVQDRIPIDIRDNYTVAIKGQNVSIKPIVVPMRSINDAYKIHESWSALTINRRQSGSYLICLSDLEKRFHINLRLIHLDTTEKGPLRMLYIVDWYVNPHLRGEGIGTQLQELADMVASRNGCFMIFGELRAEAPSDQERLIKFKKERGFEIRENIASKLLSDPRSQQD